MHKINLNDQSLDNHLDPVLHPEVIHLSQPRIPNDDKTAVDEIKTTVNNDASLSMSAKKSKYMKPFFSKVTLILSLVAIITGIGTGYGGYALQAKSKLSNNTTTTQSLEQFATTGQIHNGDVFGIHDKETFKDTAQGYLETGGIDGEGSHKLLRPGGDFQTVYLTSSITDLDKFIGMEIKIWGETFKGQKASWLMDVGRVEIIEVSGQPPTEE